MIKTLSLALLAAALSTAALAQTAPPAETPPAATPATIYATVRVTISTTLGPIVIDRVPRGSVVLVIAGAEADENLISPRPDTMVRRPTAKAPRLGEDFDKVAVWAGPVSNGVVTLLIAGYLWRLVTFKAD